MKVDILHTEKSTGLIFRKKHHGITVRVDFSEEERAIIKRRKMERDVVMERDYPSDVNAEKHANRSLGRVVATAVVAGRDANHFHLTIGRLLKGPDTYFVSSPIEAKTYEANLMADLEILKRYITENEGITQTSQSFEL